MKTMRNILAVIIILALAVSMSVAAFAATYQTEAGKTVTVTFTIPNVYGVNGWFDFSNRQLFSAVSYNNGSSGLNGEVSGDGVYIYGSNETTAIIEITVTVKGDAQAGDKCDITLNYEYALDENGRMSRDEYGHNEAMTHTVVIKATETTATEPVTTQEPTPTPPGPTPTPGPEPERIDYTELNRQIGIAEGLNENEYTKDSWDAMVKVLEEARKLRESNSQKEVDDGAKALEKAIAALVKLDYSKLKAAIAEAKGLEDCAHGPLWFKLFDALQRGNAALTSRDQELIDSLVAEIEGIIKEIKEDCPNCGKTEVVEKIVEVEKLPEGDYCNIKIHKLWPILFFISLGINLVLAGLIIGFLLKRKKNREDDTPLVDYDIEDDE